MLPKREGVELLCMDGPVPGGRIGIGFDLPGCPIIWTHPDHPAHVWRGPSAGFQPIRLDQKEPEPDVYHTPHA